MIRKWIIKYIDTDKLIHKEIRKACEEERKKADASYNTRLLDQIQSAISVEQDLTKQHKLELKKQGDIFNREYKKQKKSIVEKYEIEIKRYREKINDHVKEKKHLKKTWDIINKVMPELNYLLGLEATQRYEHMREMAIELSKLDQVDALHRKVVNYNSEVTKLIGE
jgi:hypothetical protein